jgi:hypothetical protein
MTAHDREYFMMRAEQELTAAARTRGVVRGRHEELAWLYQMRLQYLDRGITGEENEPVLEVDVPIRPFIIAA